MDKNFAKTLKTLLWDLLNPPSQANLNFFQKLGPINFLTLWCETLWGKKLEKTVDPEILHCRQMEKQKKPNWWDTPAKVGVQLIFTTCRWYRLSVVVWWYISVRLWVELFVSQTAIYSASLEKKNQLGQKTTKMATSPHVIAV